MAVFIYNFSDGIARIEIKSLIKARIRGMNLRNKNRNKKRGNNKGKGFTLKEGVTLLLFPIVISLITIGVGGYFQLKATNKSIEAQIETAIKSADAQIQAAEISKVTKIKYDYKETSNWNVDESKEYMPLEEGNFWTYKGTYSVYSPKYEKIVIKDLSIKFKILEEIRSNGVKLYKVRNIWQRIYNVIRERIDVLSEDELISLPPMDFTEEEHISGLFLVANKMFLIPNEELESVEKYMKEPDSYNNINHQIENKSPALSYDNLVFEFPMFKGQRFGDLNSITRSDMSHFWYVNDAREIEILNGDTYEEVQMFDLIYNTLPDQQKLVFRPYLGILSFSYLHNGAVDNFKFSLSEYNIKKSSTNSN